MKEDWPAFIVITLIVLIFLIPSCGSNKKYQVNTNTLNQLKIDIRREGQIPYLGFISVVTIDSCEYIIWDNSNYNASVGGIVHKQNCKNKHH